MRTLAPHTSLATLEPLRRRWNTASLRAKTLAIVAVTVGALLALIYIPLRLFVLDSYLQLEERQVITDVERGANALADDEADLTRIVTDYAARDVVWRARGDTPTLELPAGTFLAGNRLSALVLADQAGRVLEGRGFDRAAGRETAVPAGLQEQLPLFLVGSGATTRSGLLVLPNTLVLVATHPVQLNGSGAPGLLLVARPLDRNAVQEIAATTRLQLTIHRLDSEFPAPDVVAARDALAERPAAVVRVLGARVIAGYRLLNDLSGRPVAVLRVQAGRPAYEQGQASVAYFALALIFVTCGTGAAALELLERSVVARQTQLSADVRTIGEAGDLAARVVVPGGDEIGRLGDAINTMLGSLEQAQNERRAAFGQLSVLTEQLRRSRDMLRTLFDGLDDGMALVDGDGVVLAANQRFAELHATVPEAMVGAPLAMRADAGGVGQIHGVVGATLRDGRMRRERVAHDDALEQHCVLDLRVLPLVEGAGAVEQAVAHVSDVTERLRLEAAAIQSERFRAGAQLAAAVAHELNTPLQSIQSCLDLVRLAEPKQRDDYLTIAQDEIRRISGILRSLLAIHRPSDGNPAPLALNALVERLLLLTGGTLGDRGVYVECVLAPELPAALANAEQLTQVVLNLVFNAADAMPEGGTIMVRTSAGSPSEGCVRLEVSDTGAGVPDAIRARIFDPFFTTKADGSGLGLAICRQIIDEHGGQIDVGDAPGGGAVFTIELPAQAQQTE